MGSCAWSGSRTHIAALPFPRTSPASSSGSGGKILGGSAGAGGGGSGSGRQTPGGSAGSGSGGSGSGGQTPAEMAISMHSKRVTFAAELETFAEYNQPVTKVEGTAEPHLPNVRSFATFLDRVLQASLEAESNLPRIRDWAKDWMDDLSLGYVSFTPEAKVPDNWFLGVCVVCPPWASESVTVTVPLLVAQLLPFLGRVRVHLMIPDRSTYGSQSPHMDALLAKLLIELESPLRLQLLRLYLADGGEFWHDAIWRNAVAKAALSDGATVLMHLSAEQILGADMFKVICNCPWSLDLAAASGGQTPGLTTAALLQDEAEDDSAILITAAALWERIGGFDEAFVLEHVSDMVSRLRMAGGMTVIFNQDAAGLRYPNDQNPADVWTKQALSLPPAYQGKAESVVREMLRTHSHGKLSEGKVIRNNDVQAASSLRVRAKLMLLERQENECMDQEPQAEEIDWGEPMDVDVVAGCALFARGRDFVKAACSWAQSTAASSVAAVPGAAQTEQAPAPAGPPAKSMPSGFRTAKHVVHVTESSKSKWQQRSG